MLVKSLLAAACLMALCVTVHAGGVARALQRLRSHADSASGFWSEAWIFILAAAWMILLHLVEICVWGAFYFWTDSFPDLQTAFYFSAVTYTTTGYGDLVLPEEWRLVGGVEALTGILMCAWSTGFFMAVVSRVYTSRSRDES
jgi:hypothetical protein